MRQLNGWQRIGVALSVLWGAFIASLVVYENLQPQRFTHQPKPGIGELVFGPLMFIVLSILGGWLLVYAAIWTIKWIMAGFNSKEKNSYRSSENKLEIQGWLP